LASGFGGGITESFVGGTGTGLINVINGGMNLPDGVVFEPAGNEGEQN
jgi:hypothetical protein